MIQIKTFTEKNNPSLSEKEQITNFLYTHLENFGDPKNQITKAMDYALKETPSFGGFISVMYTNHDEIVGAVVVNETGMKGYIPENILVYIATHSAHRGKGLGKKLMTHAIETANGAIALHVEPDNPAKYLYEKLGFTNKYLEMRLTK